jgi:hypothetical protein
VTVMFRVCAMLVLELVLAGSSHRFIRRHALRFMLL